MQFTEEQLSSMSFQERKNAVELMELEAQAAEPVPEETASPAPVEEVNPDPAPVTTEETPQVEAPETTAPDMSEETLEYWKNKAEEWKKRKGDADRALTPAQQKAASAKKELKTKEDEWKTIALSLQEKLDSLEKRLTQEPVQKPAEVSELSPEFEATYEEIANEMKRYGSGLTGKMKAELDARLKAIEEHNARLEEDQIVAQQGQYAASHYSQLKSLHPDIDDFVDPAKKGTQLFEWASKKASYIKDVIQNPLNYTPVDVSDVLNRFKQENNIVTKKPSLGDLAVKAISVPNVPEPKEDDYLSDYEMKNFDDLMRRNARDSDKTAELVRRLEATLNRNT